MKIAIDYTPAVSQGAGIGRYTRSLVKALMQIDAENEYLLFYGQEEGQRPLPDLSAHPNFRVKGVNLSYRSMAIIWHRLQLPLPIDLLIGASDVFHATDFVLPPLRQARGIVTIHDLSFLLYADHAEANLVRYLKRAVPVSLRRASLVLADSRSTRDDVLCLLDVMPDSCHVLYSGVDPIFRPVEDAQEQARVRERLGLHYPYILFVGTIEKRKNLARLMRAYSLLRQRHSSVPKLVIGGGKGWLFDDVFSAVEDLNLQSEVVFLGRVEDEDLPALYSMAELFVYPSLYEGFGLPPLEAMACGTPVIASNTSSLPEVLGEAALLVPPTETESLAQAIASILQSDTRRAALRRAGLERAARFTWTDAARNLLNFYRQVLN